MADRYPDLATALNTYFAPYRSTLELADSLIARQAYAQEVLLLLTARLDSLAQAVGLREPSSRRTFEQFLRRFAPDGARLAKVSVGDLYYQFAHRENWLLDGMVESAGRLRRFSADDDPFIDFLWKSEIPLTREDAHKLVRRVIRALTAEFRVRPAQSRAKPVIATKDEVIAAIVAEHTGRSLQATAKRLPEALAGLIEANTLSAILYRDYRSAAIHEFPAQFYENKFYEEAEPYWAPYRSESSGWYLRVEFPASYLRAQVAGAIEAVTRTLLNTKKLPARIYFTVFDMPQTVDNLEYLDEDSIENVEMALAVRRPR